MRCTNCGHQGSPGATFCLNCGTQLPGEAVPVGAGGTHHGSGGLPGGVPPTPSSKICMRCQADNALNMKFCRQCGTSLGTVPTPVPPAAAAQAVPHSQAEIPSTLMADHGVSRQPAAPVAPIPPGRSRPATPTPPPGSLPRVAQPALAGGPLRCPACGGDTPSGFTFCQRCGKPLAAHSAPAPVPPPAGMPLGLGRAPAPATAPAGSAPSGPVVGMAPAPAPAPPTAPAGSAPAQVQMAPVAPTAPAGSAPAQVQGAPAQVQAPAAPRAVAAKRPTPRSVQMPAVSGPAWATLICVNRDGSDGAAHELRGNYVEIGSAPGAGIHFDDPYLAPCHARIERHGSGGARIVPLDKLNGIFRRLRKDTPLEHGAVVLLGRELVRFELLSKEESEGRPLEQHGITLFGSPARETWGRLLQIVPSAGIRDVRHLSGEEVVVGREVGDLVFGDDEFLSRRHAAFRWKNRQCVLADLGSSNGTFLRLAEPSNLSDGDFLRIGDQMFRFKPE